MGEDLQLKRVVELLRALGVRGVLRLERQDPQYHAVCRVLQHNGEETAARLAMLNALVSYRLSGKGEEHWGYFGRYFSRRVYDVCAEFLRYVEASPYLRLGVEARKRRVQKACGYLPDLEDLGNVLDRLAALLGADRNQKTLVFTIKILNYVYMCSRGVDRPLPFDIPIPVDYRVAHLTWCAGLIDIPPHEAMRRYREVQEVWNTISREAGIPPLHIDTVLWLAGRAVLYGENIHNIPTEIISAFQWRQECRRLSKRRGETSEERSAS